LVFAYHGEATETWTAHPFLREKFRVLLGCPAERVFDVVARSLGHGLEKRPETGPNDPKVLDRYERLIEATRLAGREKEALRLFWEGMDFQRLFDEGEYQRVHRILASFSATGSPQDLGRAIEPRARTGLVASLALAAQKLGRLEEALALRQLDDTWTKAIGDLPQVSLGLQTTSEVTRTLGRLPESHTLADAAVAAVEGLRHQKGFALLARALSAHMLGDTRAARADFAAGATWTGASTALSLSKGRHHIDLGELQSARSVLRDSGWTAYRANATSVTIAQYDALLARYLLAEGDDPKRHIRSVRGWTSRSGDMEYIIEAHLLSSRSLLVSGDPQAALGEAETGLLHAISCGYRLLRIDLLVELARIRLAWPDPPKAIQAAREALDLAAHPDCQYAWGEADAAQVWGEAYFANHEHELARRAFTRALEVRKRIEHPGVAETERWLARTS
jgi:tetratricopeptide (TPR) repeat protein